MATKIDLEQLAKEINHLEYHQKLWKVLKSGLKARGYWRDKPRGNPAKGYQAKLSHSLIKTVS